MRTIVIAALAWAGASVALATPSATMPQPTAREIVQRNVQARGGLDAWKKVQTMAWVGHMESTNAPPGMQFVLQQMRPNKTRFELTGMDQRSMRVFDGRHGWKMRATRSGSPDLQPFTSQELRFAQQEQGIDGPLIDLEGRGVAVSLEGVDDVEGRRAYHLSLRNPSGGGRDVWVDARTYLDVKYDRMSYSPAGEPRMVTVFNRDFKNFEGLMIPSVVEIGNSQQKTSEKMILDKVSLNPPLDGRMFAKPGSPHHMHTVTIDPQPSPPAARMASPAQPPSPVVPQQPEAARPPATP